MNNEIWGSPGRNHGKITGKSRFVDTVEPRSRRLPGCHWAVLEYGEFQQRFDGNP